MKELLLANIKRQKYTIISVLILVFIMCVSVFLAIMVRINSGRYISDELARMGYGDETVWINYDNEITTTAFDTLSTQKLIFAAYEVNGKHSDNEGQLVCYDSKKYPYRFFNNELNAYQSGVKIAKGTVYVSPGFASNFNATIGDTITFSLSRDGEVATFRIAGYFEDPFMGSNMIDMKSFLINEADYNVLIGQIKQIDSFQKLARSGAMIHTNQNANDHLEKLSKKLGMQMNIEFSYSRDSIWGFMMILQNIIAGFLSAFAIVLG